jgi:hypothetical protein
MEGHYKNGSSRNRLGRVGVDWIDLAHYMDTWHAAVNTVKKRGSRLPVVFITCLSLI